MYIYKHRRCWGLFDAWWNTPPWEISQSQFGRIKKFPFCSHSCRALAHPLPENIRPSNPFGIFFISLLFNLSVSLCLSLSQWFMHGNCREPSPRRAPLAYNILLQLPRTTSVRYSSIDGSEKYANPKRHRHRRRRRRRWTDNASVIQYTQYIHTYIYYIYTELPAKKGPYYYIMLGFGEL